MILFYKSSSAFDENGHLTGASLDLFLERLREKASGQPASDPPPYPTETFSPLYSVHVDDEISTDPSRNSAENEPRSPPFLVMKLDSHPSPISFPRRPTPHYPHTSHHLHPTLLITLQLTRYHPPHQHPTQTNPLVPYLLKKPRWRLPPLYVMLRATFPFVNPTSGIGSNPPTKCSPTKIRPCNLKFETWRRSCPTGFYRQSTGDCSISIHKKLIGLQQICSERQNFWRRSEISII